MVSPLFGMPFARTHVGVKVQGLSDVTSDAGCRVMCELRMRRAPFCLLAEVRLKDLHLRSDRCRLPARSGFRGLLPCRSALEAFLC